MPTPCIFCKRPADLWIRVKKKGEETFSPARPVCLKCLERLGKNENYTVQVASPPAQNPPADEMKSPPPAHIPSARPAITENESAATADGRPDALSNGTKSTNVSSVPGKHLHSRRNRSKSTYESIIAFALPTLVFVAIFAVILCGKGWKQSAASGFDLYRQNKSIGKYIQDFSVRSVKPTGINSFDVRLDVTMNNEYAQQGGNRWTAERALEGSFKRNQTTFTIREINISIPSKPTSYSTASRSTDSDIYIPSEISDGTMSKMWDAAKEEVKKNLKSPSTAKFEKYYSDNVQFLKAKADDVRTGGFNVSILSYVDSQNSFGAEIRTTFVVFFMVDRTGGFKIVDSMYY